MNKSQIKTNNYYNVIGKAIQYLSENREAQPTLLDLSAHVGLSEYHLQRIFSEWVGISPKQFLQYLTKEYAKQRLRIDTVMEAAHACGLSGPGRLHDLMVQCEGMTPGEYKNHGRGLTIYYGVCPSPFGSCFIALTDRGICDLAFFDTDAERKSIQDEFAAEWSNAFIVKDQAKIASIAKSIFPIYQTEKKPLKLLLKGSPFQLKVWEALLSIPEGSLATYQDIADLIGQPTAVRAVASAIARNNIAYIIPCHRVIRKSGEFGQYRWHSQRKQAMIVWEAYKSHKKD